MNLKKILAVVLSLSLLVTCLVSGMSLNTSAATPDQEMAKAQLTDAWNQLYYKPVVALQGFYQKNGGDWEMRESASTDVEEIEGLQVPCYTFTTAQDTKGAFILSGTADDIENKANISNFITNGSKVYFYVYDPEKNSSITDYFITSAGKSDPHSANRTTTDVDNWRKYSITIDNWSNEAAYLGRVQFGYNTTILDKKISAVVYEEKLVVPTTDSLLELVKAADDVDLAKIADGAAKDNFVSALADAVEALYTNETDIKGYLTHKWGKMSKPTEVLFDTFLYGSSFSVGTAVDNPDINAKVYTPSSSTSIPLIIVSGTERNIPTKMVKIQDYAEIYLYYSSTSEYSANASVGTISNTGSGAIKTNGSTITLPVTEGSALVKFDLKNAITSYSEYKKDYYDGTTYGWGRLHFTSVTNALTISQVLGVKAADVPDTTDKTLRDVIALAEAEDLSVYQDNAAKTEFEAALAKAKAAYYSVEANAKAAIIAAWNKVKNNPEVLFGNFYEKGSSWTDKTSGSTYNENIGAKVYTPSVANFIITPDLSEGNINILTNMVKIQDYAEIYLYYSATSAYNVDASVGTINDKGGVNIDATGVTISLSATEGSALVKFDLKSAITGNSKYNQSNFDGTSKAWGRLQFSSANNGLTISQVLGVKPLDLSAAFSDVFDAEGNAKDLTLAQLIDAYTKYDIENDYDAAELVAVVEDVCAANPKYASFKNVAGYANKVQNVTKVSVNDGTGGNGAVLAKVESLPQEMPGFSAFETTDTYKVNFTGKGASVLDTTGHTAPLIKFSPIAGFSASDDTYLGYYIPSKVDAEIKIQLLYRGHSSGGDTSTNPAYLKTVTLDKRDEWVILDSADLKPDAYSNLTDIFNSIVVDLIAPTDTAVEMYFSPFAFTSSANAIDTTGAKTLTDYAEKYNAVNVAVGDSDRYLYEAEFIAARDEFNLALADGYKLQGQGLYNENNNHYYTEGDTKYAGYRIFAQYICPLDEKGDPILDKIVVDGKAYTLNKRCILVAKNTENTFGELTATTEGIKKSEISGADLNNKYWDVKKIDGTKTAIVTYSYLLEKVKQSQTEANYHQARAMIEYNDGTSNVQIYSETKLCGTIQALHESICKRDGIDYGWFPAAE